MLFATPPADNPPRRDNSLGRLLVAAAGLYFFVAPWSELFVVGGMRSSRLLGMLVLLMAGLALLLRRTVVLAQFHRRLLLFYAWAFWTTAWAINPGLAAFGFWIMLKGLLLLLAVWQISHQPRDYDRYLDLFVAGFIVSLLLTLPGPVAEIFNRATPGAMRFSGSLANPNVYAQMIAITLPLSIVRLRSSTDPRVRLCHGLFLALGIVAVLGSGSRGGLVCMVFALGAMFLLERDNRLRGFVLAGVVAVGLLAASGLLPISTAALERLGTLGQELTEGTWSSRKPIWEGGLQVLLDNPLLGVGLSNFNRALAPLFGEAKAAHNTYLDIATETGLIGLTLFLLAFAALYRRVTLLAHLGNPGARIAFFTLCISALGTGHGHSQLTYCLLALMFGLGWVPRAAAASAYPAAAEDGSAPEPAGPADSAEPAGVRALHSRHHA